MLLETTLNSFHVWAIGHNIPNNILLGIYYLLNAMGKDHHNPRFQDHVVTDVSVVTSHHHHRLLSRYPPGCVLLVLPAQFSVSTFQITSKSYLRFICRVSNVCRPGGHRRSCAFSISSVTVWGVAIYMIKQCQQLRFHEKDPPMWTGHPDSWRDLLIMAWSTASGVEIIPPHLIKKSQLKKVIITCTLWPSPWRELLPNASHHLPQSGPGHNFFLYNGIKYL